jgi:hypothetical protein
MPSGIHRYLPCSCQSVLIVFITLPRMKREREREREKERIMFITHLKPLQPKTAITYDLGMKRYYHMYCILNCHMGWRTLGLKCNKNNYDDCILKNKSNAGPCKTVQTSMIYKLTAINKMWQVEDMMDPLHPSMKDSLLQTNIAANVLYWNAIGCIFSLFMFFFEGVLRLQKPESGGEAKPGPNKQESQSQTVEGANNLPVSIMGFTKLKDSTTISILIVASLLILWNLFFTIFFVAAAYAAAIIIVPVIYLCYCLYHLLLEKQGIADKNPYPARKRLIFWIGFTISIPFVAQCINMLLQRRDWILNWTMFSSIAVIGLCSLGIEMVQTSFEYSALHRKTNKTSGGGDEYNEVKLKTFCSRKNMVIRVIMLCTGLLVLTACAANFPSFPSTPFSNVYSILVIVTFILTLPLISSGRHLSMVRFMFQMCLYQFTTRKNRWNPCN